MTTHDIHVVGGSAGGVEALQALVSGLPGDLPAAVFVVLHVSSSGSSMLSSVLQRVSRLPVVEAEDERPIERGQIYVAVPGRHLLLEDHHMRLVRGPRENRHRPAIDVLFRSAAWTFGPRVVGALLTGMLDDGTAGLWSIRTCGGTTIVQDPAEARFPQMPANAVRQFDVDFRLPLEEIGPRLEVLARQAVDEAVNRPATVGRENNFSKMEGRFGDMPQLGEPTVFTCPACNGSLWEIHDGKMVRYRCHTGHAFAPESLLVQQTESVEAALFTALRAIEEKAAASRRIAARSYAQSPRDRDRLNAEAERLDQRADIIRRLIAGHEPNAV